MATTMDVGQRIPTNSERSNPLSSPRKQGSTKEDHPTNDSIHPSANCALTRTCVSFYFFFLFFFLLFSFYSDFYRTTENTWSSSMMAPLIKWKGSEPVRHDSVSRGTWHAPKRVSWWWSVPIRSAFDRFLSRNNISWYLENIVSDYREVKGIPACAPFQGRSN